jgi:hypothetical protein
MIETENLILRPLTYEQLVKYSNLDNSLEEELNIEKSPRSISPELREALEDSIIPSVRDLKKNYLYYTLWTLILKEANKMVGDLCFQGEPNIDGEIEIGYGTYFEFRRKIQKDQDIAMKEIMMKSYLIEGQPLTIDLLEDQLSFEDNLFLGTMVDDLFQNARPKST